MQNKVDETESCRLGSAQHPAEPKSCGMKRLKDFQGSYSHTAIRSCNFLQSLLPMRNIQKLACAEVAKQVFGPHPKAYQNLSVSSVF